MDKEKVVEQLESLKEYCTDMCECSDCASDWRLDVKALDTAINIVKGEY